MKRGMETTEWKRLEISSRKLETPREHFVQRWHSKGQKWYGCNRSRKYKRWQEYTEELYKKDLHDPDNHDGMITHLEPDILECKVGLRKHRYKQS